jgi:hypothetical protein
MIYEMNLSLVPYAVLFARICRVTSQASSNQMGNLYSGARRYSTEIQIDFVALEKYESRSMLNIHLNNKYSASILTIVWWVFRLPTVHPEIEYILYDINKKKQTTKAILPPP